MATFESHELKIRAADRDLLNPSEGKQNRSSGKKGNHKNRRNEEYDSENDEDLEETEEATKVVERKKSQQNSFSQNLN